jgi:hypothetical protein
MKSKNDKKQINRKIHISISYMELYEHFTVHSVRYRKNLKILREKSKTVNRRRTDNIMAKRKKDKVKQQP